jgi:hypothetical protein
MIPSRTSSIFLNFSPQGMCDSISRFFSSNLLHPKIIKFTHIIAEPLYFVITWFLHVLYQFFSKKIFSSSSVWLGKVFTRIQLILRRNNLRKGHKNVMGIHTLSLNHPMILSPILMIIKLSKVNLTSFSRLSESIWWFNSTRVTVLWEKMASNGKASVKPNLLIPNLLFIQQLSKSNNSKSHRYLILKSGREQGKLWIRNELFKKKKKNTRHDTKWWALLNSFVFGI